MKTEWLRKAYGCTDRACVVNDKNKIRQMKFDFLGTQYTVPKIPEQQG